MTIQTINWQSVKNGKISYLFEKKIKFLAAYASTTSRRFTDECVGWIEQLYIFI